MKSSIRVILALALVVCMMLAAGCGSQPAPTPTAAPTQAPVATTEETKEETKTETETTTETEETKTETAKTGSQSAPQDTSAVSTIEFEDNAWVSVDCGGNYTMAMLNGTTLVGWGRNSFGQVGYDNVRETNILAVQPILENVTYYSAGEQNTTAITEDGTIYIWGANHSGQIGDGTNTGYIAPNVNKTLVDTGDKIVSFSAGMSTLLAVAEDGTLYASGNNDKGQLGATEKVHKTPVAVLEGVAKAWTNGDFSMALKSDGTLWATGENNRGQLGMGAEVEDSAVWAEVTTITDVAEVALGEQFALVLKNDGTVWGVGRNNKGQLGVTTEESNQYDWVQITDGVATVFANADTAGVIKTDNTLWMWGDNSKGQCGVGSEEKKILEPTKVMDDVKDADCGFTHAAAIKNDGTLWTWGNNYYYELCDGTTTNSNVPKQVLR
ncbi:MAG: hypothetical protein Q4A66_00435 [Eubacteriales bacterium]|nr:hypothetical protein [Eubacteriales bacterium]